MFCRVLVLVWSFCLRGAVADNENPTEQFSLRLFGGDSPCQGELQVQWKGQNWTGVSPWSVPLQLGDRLCAELDCGPALGVETKTVSEREAFSLSSNTCDDTSLISCFNSSVTYRSANSLELTCSNSARLVSRQSVCSGFLQIRDRSLSQSWTSVCEGGLDHRGAEVLCRELGCGAPLLDVVLPPVGPVFHCEGNESALKDCHRTKPVACSGVTLFLTCSEPVRLGLMDSRCEGFVEMKYRGKWKRVRPSGNANLLDLEAGAAVCRSLNCGSVVTTKKKGGFKHSDVLRVRPDCLKKTASVRDCVESISSPSNYGLEVRCSDSVRLVSGRSLCSGSLEVRDTSLNHSWTSVCGGALGRQGVKVLCMELDCGTPLAHGELSPQGQTFHCDGFESALMDCPRNQIRTCSGPTLQVSCSEPAWLVGGASRCEGTVVMRHREKLGRMITPDLWDLEAADGICRALDCGSAVSTEQREGFENTQVWEVRADCVKKMSAVRDCVIRGLSDRVYGVKVVCSASLSDINLQRMQSNKRYTTFGVSFNYSMLKVHSNFIRTSELCSDPLIHLKKTSRLQTVSMAIK